MKGNNLELNRKRAKKMMLLFALLSITMTFAGLTSAYLVSKGRPDWLIDFQLPNLFFYSTFIIILSSFTIQVSYYYLKTNQSKNKVITWLLTTFLLGVIFCFLQFYSFKSLIEMGYFFAGAQSTITTSFIYVLTFLHGLHLLAGLIVLTVLIHNTIKNKYMVNKLGFELGTYFWHFLDILWVYLFLFFYFFG
tara:strand:+ start:1218 stop:1793 length:576 start_codon:yes stop_codon:yes gene_type:complete